MSLRKSNVRRAIFLLAACFPITAAAAADRSDVGVTDVLYVTASEWQQLPPARKVALSAAFMRIFCTDIRMPPERLVTCLDKDGKTEPVFERAIACSAAIVRSDLAVDASR